MRRPLWVIKGWFPLTLVLAFFNWRTLWNVTGGLVGGAVWYWWPLELVILAIVVWYWSSVVYILQHRKEHYEYRKATTDRLRGASAPYLTYAGAGNTFARAYARVSSYARKGFRKGSGALVPDQVDPFTGYRGWNLRQPYGITGLFYENDWTSGDNAAECPSRLRRGHFVGDATCVCGFYAFKSEKDLGQTMVMAWDTAEWQDGRVLYGTVEMFGLVTEHEFGYRSSHARISGIYDLGPVSRSVAKHYAIPLIPLPSRAPKVDAALPLLTFNEILEAIESEWP